MRTGLIVILGSALALALAPACGDKGAGATDGGSDSGSSSGTDGTAATGATGGVSATSASATAGTDGGTDSGTGGTAASAATSATSASSTGSTSASGTGGNLGCGATACDGPAYCDWAVDSCAARWDTAVCTDVPTECTEEYAPVCGCDGAVHDNICFAAAAGVDVSAAGGCRAPGGLFPCGGVFCEVGSYCQVQVSDVGGEPDGYACIALPDGCGDSPSCDCLSAEPCFETGCEPVNGGGFEILCPGG